MPKGKEAAEQWLDSLKAQGKLSDETFDAIKNSLTPESLEFVGASALRQEDYSKHMEQLKREKAEQEAFQVELSNWKSQAETEYFEMQRQKAAAEAEIERLKTIAKDYVPESELGKVNTVTPKRDEPVVPQFDPKDYISQIDAQAALLNTIKVTNQIMAIGAQHQKLFGEPLDDAELVDRAIANKRDVSQEWEAHYKVADKRAEIVAKQQEVHDQKIREEERARLLSELKLPETRPGAPRSPVMTIGTEKPAETPADRQSGLQAALEAYGAGTYRSQS